jgi:exosortase/archaeosortase family protein
MDRRNPQNHAMIRTLVAGLLVFGLLQTTRMADALSWLTRPAVAVVMALMGGEVSDQGTHLVIGELRVPWSRDCAGFDVLLVLWGLIIWTCRHEPLARRFWLRMALAVPAALVANVARVLTIIAWRRAFYPAVESPQMHYFIGFVWLLPLLVFFIPRGGKSVASWIIGMALPAAALSLVAPQVSAPGGVLVTAATLLLLAAQQQHPLESFWEKIFAVLWVGAAFFIAGSGMESLWLPWLLACPWCLPRGNWLLSLAVLLPGTVPLFAMKLPWLVVPALVWGLFVLWRASRQEPSPLPAEPRWPTALALGLLILLPFTASSLGPVLVGANSPPGGLMARPLEPGSWQIRFARQAPNMVLTWHAPSGSGRHHTLPVCLSYRGGKLHPEPTCPAVFTDGELWLAEAFLMPDGELYPYEGYLRRTLLPFTYPGVHLIASARRDSMEAADFEKAAEELFARVAACESGRFGRANKSPLSSLPKP